MKFLYELAKLLAKKTASLGRRKKDVIGDPFIRRRGDWDETSKDLQKNIHERTERVKARNRGGDRRKEERRKPPEYSGN